ncbi:MAG: M3 family metallopeptidase [Nitrososphaeraceae archaeon]|nr:M3 family metallopeptidase [Nitrososphaeraceae archaeon]
MDLSEKIMLNWDMDPNELINLTETIIKKSKDVNRNITNLETIANDINELQTFHSICGCLQYISPNNQIRKASIKCDLMLTKYINELDLRQDIYHKFLEIKKKNKLSPDDAFFVDKLILNYERNGINLDKDKRELLLKIKHEISKLENGIANYICQIEKNTFELSKNQVKGIPENILKNFIYSTKDEKGEKEKKYKIKANKNNYSVCMKYISDEKTREYIELYYSNMCSGESLMNYIAKLIVLRDKHAKILSYKCHSDYKAFIQMTKNSNNIKNFMAELLTKLNFRYTRELDTIKKFNSGKQLNTHDIQYYITKWKQEYGINDNSLKEYFEFNNTINEIFKIYEKLFSISFVKLSNKNTWHPDVTLYAVLNKNQKLIGHLYLDVFSRESKYKQTRCFCLRPAILTGQLPSVVLMSSIGNKSVSSSPVPDITLVNFQDVICLFHEMAHVMHHILGKTKYTIFSGLNVEVDFVETPAQILDLLCWEKDVIKRLSHHYQTGESLDDKLINKLIKLKNIDVGIFYKKHILVSLFDQMIYSSQSIINSIEETLKTGKAEDIQNLMSSIYKQLNNEIMTDNNKNQKYRIKLNEKIGVPYEWLSTFLGSDSQYYCSIWSRVLSADVYNEKIKGNITSDIGDELVEHIFQHGGTKPGYEMICSYMKRIPSIDGFISMHDLDKDMEYSFFLNTDQIAIDDQNNDFKDNNGLQGLSEYSKHIETEANKFSEINESAIYITDIEHQTERY